MADLVALLGNVLFHFLSLKESANVVLLDSALFCSVSDQPGRSRGKPRASLMAQLVKNPPAMQETPV